MGGLTNAERIQLIDSDIEVGYCTEDYLSKLYPAIEGATRVNSCCLLDEMILQAIAELPENSKLIQGNSTIAINGNGANDVNYSYPAIIIDKRWDLYRMNSEAIALDFQLLTAGKMSAPISESNQIIGDPDLVFLEAGAEVEASILNTNSGPIYLGVNAEIMEGSIVRGGLMMAESSALKLGAKIYGPTTLGPHCKVGGEVNNSIFQAYSNKGHDGFLGNSLIGEWCNLGADTNTSNLKNNYGMVKTYSYKTNELVQTDVQFMGLTMGDHSKCAINTIFNTATVVGVCSNLFSAGFPDKYIKSFRWGDNDTAFNFDKALEVATNMMGRRGKELKDNEIDILRYIADNK